MSILRVPVLVFTAAGVALAGCATQSQQPVQKAEVVQDLPLVYRAGGAGMGGVQIASLEPTASDAPQAMTGTVPPSAPRTGQVLMVLAEEAEEEVPVSTIEQRMRDVARQEAEQAASLAANQAAQQVALDAEDVRQMAQRTAQQVAWQEAQQQSENLARMAQITQQAARQAAQDEVRQTAGQTQLEAQQAARREASLVAQKEASLVALREVRQGSQLQNEHLAYMARVSQQAARQAAQDEARQVSEQTQLKVQEVAQQVATRETRQMGEQAQLKAQLVAQQEAGRLMEQGTRQAVEQARQAAQQRGDELEQQAKIGWWAARQEAERAARQVAESTAQQVASREAQRKAEEVAGQKADEVAQRKALEVAQQVVDQSPVALNEKRMRQLAQQEARQAVAEAQPGIRALAMQSVQDSKDYIGTVARGAVRDGDPAMSEALSAAARKVIATDGGVAFAIRKVVEEQLRKGDAAASTSVGMTVLKSDETQINAASLGIGDLKTPYGLNPQTAGQTAEVSGSMTLEPNEAGAAGRRPRLDLRKYRVVMHADDLTLQQMMEQVINQAAPFTGRWTVKWKVSGENTDILAERFSLDAETTFDNFVNYLSQYMVNERGVKMSFSLFDTERIIVISD